MITNLAIVWGPHIVGIWSVNGGFLWRKSTSLSPTFPPSPRCGGYATEVQWNLAMFREALRRPWKRQQFIHKIIQHHQKSTSKHNWHRFETSNWHRFSWRLPWTSQQLKQKLHFTVRPWTSDLVRTIQDHHRNHRSFPKFPKSPGGTHKLTSHPFYCRNFPWNHREKTWKNPSDQWYAVVNAPSLGKIWSIHWVSWSPSVG